MKDAIDKRNDKQRIARSIVKRRNIIYTSREELDRRQKEEQHQENREAAEQLVKQFREEANKKQAMEIERLLVEQDMLEKQLETGMDATGKKPMDDVMQERVEAILNEKKQALQDIITSRSLEMEEKDRQMAISLQQENQADGASAEESFEGNAGWDGEASTESDLPEMEAGMEGGIPLDESILSEAGVLPEEGIAQGESILPEEGMAQGESILPEESIPLEEA